MTTRRPVVYVASLLALAGLASSRNAAADEPPPPVNLTLEVAAGAPVAPAEPPKEQQRALAHGVDEKESPASPDAAKKSRGAAAGGFRGTFGPVFTERVDPGWFGRLEAEAFTVGTHHAASPVAGALIGGELWFAPKARGGGLPMSFYLGYRTPGLFTAFGLGADFFIIDEVHDDTGFGVYAPFGTAAVGAELAGFRIMLDARALYRWQWGADDRAQLQVGLSIAEFVEKPIRGGYR